MKIELLDIFIEKDLNYERSGNLGMPKQSLEWRLCPILTTICSNSFLDFYGTTDDNAVKSSSVSTSSC